MEMACHRRLNGTIWCAPMEKFEPGRRRLPTSANTTTSGKLGNFVTAEEDEDYDEYGTGFKPSPLGELRENNIKNEIGLRTLEELPESISWRKDISPVQHQGKCGSCMAFATMAALEFCYRRKTGKFGDFSEQQLVDCAYDWKGAAGCHGAELESYLDWLKEEGVSPTREEHYPYLYAKPNLSCPDDLAEDSGVWVTGYYSTGRGTEAMLKELVATRGPVISTVTAYQEFKEYTTGVYADCYEDQEINHAVLVVGYGTTDEGEDYWLVKNSWGIGWGEGGYMRIKRGVGMCKIGRNLAGVQCALNEEDGDGDDNALDNDGDERRRTTDNFRSACEDVSSNCADFDLSFCDLPRGIGASCRQYCGRC